MQHASGDLPARMDNWIGANQPLVDRWMGILGELQSGSNSNDELAMYMVAAQELAVLSQSRV